MGSQGDRAFSLTADERQRIRAAQLDPDAVEELLRRVPADHRASTLQSILGGADDTGPSRSAGEGALPDISVLVSISDPNLQELLDKAWAPRWKRYSLEKLERMEENLPGLRSAIREARKQKGLDS
jgi:hypothetical protein